MINQNMRPWKHKLWVETGGNQAPNLDTHVYQNAPSYGPCAEYKRIWPDMLMILKNKRFQLITAL